MKRILNVYLYNTKVGVLSEDATGNLQFQYDKDAKYSLSLRMPVANKIYNNHYAEPFFGNLTPEGDALNFLASEYNISKDNTFSILDKIGGDCAGAVSLFEGEMIDDDTPLIKIDEDKMAEIITKLPTNPLLTGMDNAPRLSLAGVQSKFAIRKRDNGKYYTSNAMHPTTHIIKIENIRFKNILENELFCMNLAKKILGLRAIDVTMHQAKGKKYIEIERYDRRKKIIKANYTDDYMEIYSDVERVHQEDFCQILGVLAKKKYESEGGPGIRDLYNAIIKYSSPFLKILDIKKFLELIMFNYLIGNTDAHGKNFSVLHHKDGGVYLTPAYDLLSVEVYPKKTVSHQIAMKINNKIDYEKVLKKDWVELYKQLDLNPNIIMNEMKKKFINIIKEAENLCDEFNKNELTNCEIYDNIIEIIKKRYETLFIENK